MGHMGQTMNCSPMNNLKRNCTTYYVRVPVNGPLCSIVLSSYWKHADMLIKGFLRFKVHMKLSF